MIQKKFIKNNILLINNKNNIIVVIPNLKLNNNVK